MSSNIAKFVSKMKRGIHYVVSSVELVGVGQDSPLGLVRGYENACLEVYDSLCGDDRLKTAFALERYLGAVAAVENQPEPRRSELRGLISERDVVPPVVEVTVDGLSRDVQSVPEGLLQSLLRARFNGSDAHPASIRRIECALELMAISASRRAGAKKPSRQLVRRAA
jgi:hypothetical protein